MQPPTSTGGASPSPFLPLPGCCGTTDTAPFPGPPHSPLGVPPGRGALRAAPRNPDPAPRQSRGPIPRLPPGGGGRGGRAGRRRPPRPPQQTARGTTERGRRRRREAGPGTLPPRGYLHRSSKTLLGISARLVSMGKRGSSRRGEARATVQRRGRDSRVPARRVRGAGRRGSGSFLRQSPRGGGSGALPPGGAASQSAGELLRERNPQVMAGGSQWALRAAWGVTVACARGTRRATSEYVTPAVAPPSRPLVVDGYRRPAQARPPTAAGGKVGAAAARGRHAAPRRPLRAPASSSAPRMRGLVGGDPPPRVSFRRIGLWFTRALRSLRGGVRGAFWKLTGFGETCEASSTVLPLPSRLWAEVVKFSAWG